MYRAAIVMILGGPRQLNAFLINREYVLETLCVFAKQSRDTRLFKAEWVRSNYEYVI